MASLTNTLTAVPSRPAERGPAPVLRSAAVLSGRETLTAFDELVQLHQPRVLRTAYRLLGRVEDAQDAAQEVFMRLLKNLDRVDADPQAWLYRVTVNVCNDQFRKRRGVVMIATGPDDIAIDPADPSPNAEQVFNEDQRKQLLMEGLETLAERERASVVLRDIEGLTTREVAAILGVEEVTVRSQISIARVKLARFVATKQGKRT